MTATADNFLWIYDNYDVILNVNHWQFTDNVRLSTETCLLAMKAQDTGGVYGLIASTNTGVFTDSTWKCVGVEESGWHTESFDDSHWPQADELFPNGEGLWGTFDLIDARANWIWFEGGSENTVTYCRKRLCAGTQSKLRSSYNTTIKLVFQHLKSVRQTRVKIMDNVRKEATVIRVCVHLALQDSIANRVCSKYNSNNHYNHMKTYCDREKQFGGGA